MDERARGLLRAARDGTGAVVVLTGAGVSAASGIPTFRGPEGYWRIGSRNYQPEHLATREAFVRMPEAIWAWYLYRRGVCLAAAPNAAHRALVALEKALGDRFVLITQNVDGLHPRAGSSAARTLQIHGNLHFARCLGECGPMEALPEGLGRGFPRDGAIDAATAAALHCGRCGQWLRPHVLWFDEYYDEEHYRSESAMAALADADLLLVVGTAGATALPAALVGAAVRHGVPLLVQNLEPSPFSDAAERHPRGAFVPGAAEVLVPEIVRELGG